MLLIQRCPTDATASETCAQHGLGIVVAPPAVWASVDRQSEPQSCWMDKDMPRRSQGGIEVAPRALSQSRNLLLALVLLLVPVARTIAQEPQVPQNPEPTIVQSVPMAAAAADSSSGAALTTGEDLPAWMDADVTGQEVSMMPLIAKVCLGLGLVVALAWGSVWLLRRTALGQGAVGGGSAVRVMERTWLAPKKAIFLVDIAGRTLALGVTEEQISVLSSWEDGQIDVQPSAPGPGAFAIQLKSLLNRGDRAVQEAGA